MRAAAIVIALVLLVGCSGARDSETSERSASNGTRIDLASLSGRIVFSDFDDVWSVNADGSDLKRLTRAPWPEFDPSWAPDGRSIAYRSEPHGQPQLWVMDADGTDRHRLARDGGFPDWTTDGIAFAPGGGSSGRSWIAIMDPDGSGRRVPHTDYGEYPSWSPDGERIAFNSNLSGDGLMYVVDADGSRLVDLSGVGQGHEVAWSPDGRSILFASDRDHADGYNDIYVMRPDGSDVTRLTRSGAETPAWSPDGRYILFATIGGLGVMRADGSGVTLLPIEGVGEATFPDWR